MSLINPYAFGPATPVDPSFSLVTFLSEFGPAFDASLIDLGPNAESLVPLGVPNRGRTGKFGTGYFKQPSDFSSSAGGSLAWTNVTNAAFSNSDWCVEAWVRSATEPQNGTTNMPIIARYRSTGTQKCWKLGYTRNNAGNTHSFVGLVSLDGTTDLTCSFKTGTTSNDGWTTAQIFDGNWHHVAMVRSGTTVKMYVDGVAGATTAAVSTTAMNDDASTPVVIGAQINSALPTLTMNTPCQDIELDELRISVGAARYTSNFTPPAAIFGRNSGADANWSSVKLLVAFDDRAGMFNQYGSTTKDYLFTGLAVANQYFTSYGLAAGGNAHQVASDAAFDFAAGDFSVEVWFKTGAAVTATKQIVGCWGSSGNFSWRIGISTSSALSFQYSLDGTTIVTTSFGAITTATIYSVAVCRIGTTVYLFLNGTQVATNSIGSGTIKDSLVGAIPLAIGGVTSGSEVQALRITKGVGAGRYNGSTYVVPTIPLPIA